MIVLSWREIRPYLYVNCLLECETRVERAEMRIEISYYPVSQTRALRHGRHGTHTNINAD